MAHIIKGSALVPDQQERTGLAEQGYGIAKALYSCGLTALPPNGGWSNGRNPVDRRRDRIAHAQSLASTSHCVNETQLGGARHVAACSNALAVAALPSLRRRGKALRRASKRHRGTPDQLDRGRPKQPRHQITSALPESAACGSPPGRAYRPYGAVAEWLKAAVC